MISVPKPGVALRAPSMVGLWFAAYAQAALIPTRAAGQERALLNGFVAEEETGQLIGAATVRLVEAGIETRTADDGSFVFENAPLGRYFVRVKADGYPAVVQEVELAPGGDVLLPIFLTSAAAVIDELMVVGKRSAEVPNGAMMTAADLLSRQVPEISIFTMGGRRAPTGLGLRGRSTFGSGEPIVVLDGVRFSGGVGQA